MDFSSKPVTVVCLGDSTTAGTPGFFSPRERPPEGEGNPQSQYAYWILQQKPNWTVMNRGVRGQRTDQMLRRFNWDVPPHKPDIVVVLGGVNDINQEKELPVIQSNLTQIYDLALAEKAKVLACSILPLNILSDKEKKKVFEMNAWVKKTAKEKGLAFCDTYSVLDDPFRPGFLQSSPDDIHPDVEGYKAMGLAILEAIYAAWPEFRTSVKKIS